jgi:cell division protein FtsB
MIGVESYRAVQSQQAIARLNSEIDHLEQDIQVFNAVIENGDDQQYREQLARRQGFIYPEELRIVTVPLRVTERP